MKSAIVKLEENGMAAQIKYNIPEPVVFDGTNIIELSDLDRSMFRPPPVRPLSKSGRESISADDLTRIMREGFNDPRLFPDLGVPAGTIRYADFIPGPDGQPQPFRGCYITEYGPQVSAERWTTPELRNLSPAMVLEELRKGRNLNIVQLPSHLYTARFVEAIEGNPRLAIVEYYRMSSFLGSYGAGRTINTFSLLPGERTKVSIKSYKKSTENLKRSSSVLDSLNDESSMDFENMVQDERSDKSNSSRTDAYHAEAEASLNLGVASAKVNTAYKGQTSQAREEFMKGTQSALEKHVARASNHRNIKVEQSEDSTIEATDEYKTERELRNINVSRTLNFVFRQMNQEFITLLHLVDIRVAYSDGVTARIVPLYKLDEFLNDVLATKNDASGMPLPSDQQPSTMIAKFILDEVQTIVDYRGMPQIPTEKVERRDENNKVIDTMLRFRKDLRSSYTALTGASFDVPGIIVSAFSNVIRTDGIITEALLGGANALDDYSVGLQQETVGELKAKNDLLEKQIERESRAQALVQSKNKNGVSLLRLLYPPPSTPAAPAPAPAPMSTLPGTPRVEGTR